MLTGPKSTFLPSMYIVLHNFSFFVEITIILMLKTSFESENVIYDINVYWKCNENI